MSNRNTIKKNKDRGSSSTSAFSRRLYAIFDGSWLNRENMISMLPFFMFLSLLAVVLIFNTYYAEKKAREVEQIRREITELRVRYVTTRSELMFLSNQSEVARRLGSRGIIESTVPPRRLQASPERLPLRYRLFKKSNPEIIIQ